MEKVRNRLGGSRMMERGYGDSGPMQALGRRITAILIEYL
jgi:hypothetical protein